MGHSAQVLQPWTFGAVRHGDHSFEIERYVVVSTLEEVTPDLCSTTQSLGRGGGAVEGLAEGDASGTPVSLGNQPALPR